MQNKNTEKSIQKIQDGFNELVENESPEFALGMLDSVKIAYSLVVLRRLEK